MGFNRSSIRYKPTGLTKLTLRTEVKAIELAKKHQANGYKSITTMLRRLGIRSGKHAFITSGNEKD